MCLRSYKQAWCRQGAHFFGAHSFLRDDLCGQARFFKTGAGNCEQGIVGNHLVFQDPVVVLCEECRAAQRGR